MTSRSLHDFTISTHLGFRLCARCARADLARTRAQACQPLPPEELQATLASKLAWVRRFRGLAPFSSKQGEA